MLTTLPTSNVSFASVSSQAETVGSGCDESGPSPAEVHRRVMEIRASWDVQERLARRREARDRFEHLVEALCGGHAA